MSSSRCGEYDELIDAERVGIVVHESDGVAYLSAARELSQLLCEPGLAQRCQTVAERFLGLDEVVVPRYAQIYRSLIQ